MRVSISEDLETYDRSFEVEMACVPNVGDSIYVPECLDLDFGFGLFKVRTRHFHIIGPDESRVFLGVVNAGIDDKTTLGEHDR